MSYCGRKVRCRGSVLCSSDYTSAFQWLLSGTAAFTSLSPKGTANSLLWASSSQLHRHPVITAPALQQQPPALRGKKPSQAEVALKTKEQLPFICTENTLSIPQTQSFDQIMSDILNYVQFYATDNALTTLLGFSDTLGHILPTDAQFELPGWMLSAVPMAELGGTTCYLSELLQLHP